MNSRLACAKFADASLWDAANDLMHAAENRNQSWIEIEKSD